MKRSDIIPMPEYFDKYINLVTDIPLVDAFENSLKEIKNTNIEKLEKTGNKVYALGKWTVKEIFQHLIDVERVLCYRALLIARNDKSLTPGFDEKYISDNSKANDRNLREIIDELIIVRQSTIALFKSFDKEIMLRKGINWKYEMTVLAFGFCIIGHQIWHVNILQEKYYNL